MEARRTFESGRAMAEDTHHPPSFACPISRQCMRDPVVLSDGHSYERAHIERWLQQHNTSPVSGAPLESMVVFPNHALRNAIQEYFEQLLGVHRRAVRASMRALEGRRRSFGCEDGNVLRAMDALMQCSLLMHEDLSTECVLRHIMGEAKTIVGAEVASVFLLDSERQELYSTVNSTGGELRIPHNTGIAGHVATTEESVIVHDAYGDARFSNTVDARTRFRTRNIMCVPLKVRNRGIMGVVQLINKNCGSGPDEWDGFSTDDLRFLRVFASQAATAIANSFFLGLSGCMERKGGITQAEVCMPDKAANAATKTPGGTPDGPPVASKRSGRTRQRLAKWKASVRCRTPTPDAFLPPNERAQT